MTASAGPRLVSCYFGSSAWDRLAGVLRLTAARHCPDWTIEITRLPPVTPRTGKRQGDTANTEKLEHWARVVEQAEEGEQLLLIDADVSVVRPLDDVWHRSFDFAYTTKPGSHFPFNAGVVFLRVNPISRWFMAAWATENRRLYYRDPVQHTALRARYGGMNQAALGSLIQQRAFQASATQVLELPCAEWNCEESAWARFTPEVTRLLHVKGSLRSAVIGPRTLLASPLRRAAEYWLGLDREARHLEARAS